jgi:hypothetical protein
MMSLAGWRRTPDNVMREVEELKSEVIGDHKSCEVCHQLSKFHLGHRVSQEEFINDRETFVNNFATRLTTLAVPLAPVSFSHLTPLMSSPSISRSQ